MKIPTPLIHRYILYTKLLLFFGLFASCTKDPVREVTVSPPDTTTVPVSYKNGIFIINEGNYNWGNASVSVILPDKNLVIQDIFQKANSRSLGDVAESMKIKNNLGYLIVNNSNRIEVVTVDNFKSLTTIPGLNSPRFMEFVDSTKAYITNLQKNITVIDLRSNTISKVIKTATWTENLLKYDRYMLVTSIGKFSDPTSDRVPVVYVIDTQTDQITDSILTGKEPIGMVIDKKQKVWVLCSGGYDNFEQPSLLRINPELRIIEKKFTFTEIGKVPSKLCINPTGDTLYYLNGGVYMMAVSASALPSQSLIPSEGRLLYGLAIHPLTGHIFVSDAKDYVQNGTAYQYNHTGTLLKEFQTGRIPGSFCFSESKSK